MITKRLIGTVALLGLSMGVANAATATLSSGGQAGAVNVARGPAGAPGTFTIDLTLDLGSQESIGGGFDINWDSNLFSLLDVNVTSGTDPDFSRPGDMAAGSLNGLAFGDFNPFTGSIAVATLTFQVLAGSLGESGFFSLGANVSPAGGLVGPLGNPLDVDYNGLNVNVVPLPAAAWLLAGGLGMLFGFRRKAA